MNASLDDGVARLGMALLHFVWQGALVGCLAAMALALLRNARAQTRYAVCGAALLLCVLLPAWQCLVPWQPPTEPVAVAAPVELDAAGAVPPRRGHTLSTAWLQPGLPTLVLAWSLGAVLMALRLALGLRGVQRLRAAADGRWLDPAWAARLAALARRMGLRRVPRLLVAEGVDGPVIVGGWRPMVLLPASLLLRMPTELVEALLAHELAHVRRWDYLANLLQSAAEVLLFYHPVVWWLSRRMRTERELVADDLAAQALGSPRPLALALAALAQWQAEPSPPHALALAAQGGSLMHRITHLVRPIHQPMGGSLLWPMAGLAGLAALALAAHAADLTPSPPAPPAPPPAAIAALPEPPSPPTPPVEGPQTIHLGDAKLAFAFALVSGKDGSSTLSGNQKDLREVQFRRNRISGDFLWVRQGTQRYIVTDPAALAQAQALFAPVNAFDADMDKLDQQMDAQADAIERMADEIEAQHAAPSAELDGLGKRMEQLQKQHEKAQAAVEKLSRRMAATRDEKLLAQLEQEQERLEQALEPLEDEIEALSEQMERVSGAHEHALEQAFDRKQQDANQAMEALSQRMEKLSQQQEAAAKAAEQQLRALVQGFVKRGVAMPV